MPEQKLKYIYCHHIDGVVIQITLSETSIDDKEIVKYDEKQQHFSSILIISVKVVRYEKYNISNLIVCLVSVPIQ